MLWIKAFHIIAIVCWFAAIFYLPRLFVYHAMSEDQVSRERFKVMERKLYRAIMTPSAIVSIALGIWMLTLNWPYYQSAYWLHAKLTLVLLLIGYHLWCRQIMRQFAQDKVTRSHVYFRWFNELPVLLLVAIVILVVVRPF